MGVQVASIRNNHLSLEREEKLSRTVLLLCRVVAVSLALLEAWSQRYFLNEDGVAYLDMSDVFVKHNWHLLVNPIWSPLYPVFIGIATWFMHPSARQELVLVHVLNLLIFVAAMFAFEFLLRQVITICMRREGATADVAARRVPVWALQLIGYGFFIWSTLGMIWAPRMITPDLCVATFVYLDCALLLKLRDGRNKMGIGLLLGLALGVGYIAKAILFPIGFLVVPISLLFVKDRKRAFLPVIAMFGVFALVAAPLFVAMSARVGKLSYSEAGNLNYAWHVNLTGAGKLAGGPFFPSEAGAPDYLRHPLTLLFKHPEAYSFREPLVWSYAPRGDMEYWGAGTKAPFNLRNQVRATTEGVGILFRDSHIAPLSVLILIGFLIAIAKPSSSGRFEGVSATWPMMMIGVVATILYLLISVEPRYVAPFFTVVLLGLLPAILPFGEKVGALKMTTLLSLIAVCLSGWAAALVAYHVAGFPRGESKDVFLRVGELLNANGVQPGDDLAIIGDSSDGSRWARMGRVHIIAQVLREDVNEFWQATPATRDQVLAAFQQAGAKAVVAEDTPQGDLAGWKRLGETHYYVRLLLPNLRDVESR